MPIYNYKCEGCQESFSRVEKINSDGNVECPKKGCREKPKRVISKTSFKLAGKGWYADGY